MQPKKQSVKLFPQRNGSRQTRQTNKTRKFTHQWHAGGEKEKKTQQQQAEERNSTFLSKLYTRTALPAPMDAKRGH
jgi:hypothetical protein